MIIGNTLAKFPWEKFKKADRYSTDTSLSRHYFFTNIASSFSLQLTDTYKKHGLTILKIWQSQSFVLILLLLPFFIKQHAFDWGFHPVTSSSVHPFFFPVTFHQNFECRSCRNLKINFDKYCEIWPTYISLQRLLQQITVTSSLWSLSSKVPLSLRGCFVGPKFFSFGSFVSPKFFLESSCVWNSLPWIFLE